MTTVSASGLTTIPLQKLQVFFFFFVFFSLRWAQKIANASDLFIYPQDRKKLAATTAPSRCSRTMSRPQRSRDTKLQRLEEQRMGIGSTAANLSQFEGTWPTILVAIQKKRQCPGKLRQVLMQMLDRGNKGSKGSAERTVQIGFCAEVSLKCRAETTFSAL